MADASAIEWTDATWNPTVGCSIVSPGCTNCYAMKMAARVAAMGGKASAKYAGLTRPSKAGPVWNGTLRLDAGALLQPLRWRKGRRIFVNSMSDLFHEDLPDVVIDKIFAVMALAPQHTFQVLTKRAKRMRAYVTGASSGDGVCARIADQTWTIAPQLPARAIFTEAPVGPRLANGEPEFGYRRFMDFNAWPLPNVWLGVSAEDQARADERIPDLLATPAAVRFVSAEPLLGSLDLRPWLSDDSGCEHRDDGEGFAPPRCSRRDIPRAEQCPDRLAVFRNTDKAPRVTLDWIIVGGESGPGARPMHPDWARAIRDQCAAAGVPFFFKQWGEWGAIHVVGGGNLGEDLRRGTVRHICRDRENDGHFRAGDYYMRAIGKARAGRTLDGVTHSAFPTPP